MVWFNRDTGQIRSDRKLGPHLTQFARSADESLLYASGSHVVLKSGPNEPPKLGDAAPFELRIIGLCNEGEFEFRWPYADFRAFFDGLEITGVVRESETLTRLSWDTRPAQPHLRRTLWLDSGVGYQPVRMEQVLLSGSEPAQRRSHTTSDTRYDFVNGVWVPQQWSVSDASGTTNYTLAFTWASVNEAVADSVFRLDGFGLKTGVGVANSKLGKPFIESVIGMPGIGVKPISGNYERSAPLRWVLAVANLVVFAALGYLVWRRRNLRGSGA